MRRYALAAVAAAVLVAPVLAQNQPAQAPPAAAPAAPPQRPAAPPLGPNEWAIDSNHSAANFSVRHNVVTTVRGQLGKITGKVEYDGKDVKTVKAADISIDVNGINTQVANRDTHLRSPDFFDVANHPTMTFKSKRVEPGAAGRFKLVGDLTIRGNTKEVVLDVEGPSPIITSTGQRGTNVLTGATASTKISRKEFGILWNNLIETLPVVGDEVAITIDLELRRTAPPGK